MHKEEAIDHGIRCLGEQVCYLIDGLRSEWGRDNITRLGTELGQQETDLLDRAVLGTRIIAKASFIIIISAV